MSPTAGSKRLVLLGAGASAPAGVPTANVMTRQMAAALDQPPTAALHRALAVIVGGLQMGAGWETQPISWDIDVERVMNAAQLLANRFDAELAPFVGNWHPVLEELERREFAEAAKRSLDLPSDRLPSLTSPKALEDFANKALRQLNVALKKTLSLFDNRPDGHLFQNLCQQLTDNLVQQVRIDDRQRVSYLAPLVEFAAAQRNPIATLNYDNSIEICAENLGITCDDGIARWDESGAFHDSTGTSDTNGLHLIKLHGSADWWWNSSPESGAPPDRLRRATSNEMRNAAQKPTTFGRGWLSGRPQSAVIFGGKNKLTAEGPFLDLLFWFREELQQCDEIIAIGYSFRDNHINQLILSWLHGKKTRRIHVITLGDTVEAGIFYRKHIAGLGSPRLSVDRTGAIEGIRRYFSGE